MEEKYHRSLFKTMQVRLPKPSFSNFFLGFLVMINVLPVLAPILQHIGFDFGARVIYFIYSFFCHQIHWRSLHVYDHQCAWCSRDMAIWGALLTTAFLVKAFKLKGIRWWQIVPFMVPIGLDGGVQTIATFVGLSEPDSVFYVASNLSRMLTGAIFGIGLGAFLMPLLMDAERTKLKHIVNANLQFGTRKVQLKLHQLWVFFVVFLFVIISYIGFIQVWDATSEQYLPSNWLDSQIKLPADTEDWFVRRENAICPVTIGTEGAAQMSTTELLALDCFW
ncbi:MAG: DUF2085 domain-containing protein [Candidatus Dojkabacteria bacterium]